MGTEVPGTQDSSGESNSNSDSENGSSSESSGSEWEECSNSKQSGTSKHHFSVTSCDTGLKLKIAAIPRKILAKDCSQKTTTKQAQASTVKSVRTKRKKSCSDSSLTTCSNCSSDSSSDDDIPLKTVSKSLSKVTKAPQSSARTDSDNECSSKPSAKGGKDKPCTSKTVVKRTNSDDSSQEAAVKRGRGRPRKFASPTPESGACGSSSSSSSTSLSSTSSSSSSSSSDSDSADAAGGSNHASADDSNAALAAACQLHIIDEADLAELFPEQTSSAATQQNNFSSSFAVHNTSLHNDNKSIGDNGDGSSSEMELTPQLVTAAIQRATADSSSENECSNPGVPLQTTTHYASSLLQQFVAQTQLLSSSASMTPMSSTTNAGVSCSMPNNTMEGVATINDCVLSQINTIPDIPPITTNYLSGSQHLSPQQSEELSQINKDLEEITSVTESVSMTIPNPPSLDDCVDNNDFMSIDITHGGLGSASDLLKSSPMTVASTEMTPNSQIDSQRLDTISTNSIESQEDVKNVVVESRRKRGRPRKVREPVSYRNKSVPSLRENKPGVDVNDFHNSDPPNVSPDSGILSNHNSPSHSPVRRHDLDVAPHNRSRKSVQKENNTRERRSARSKSRSRNQQRSDSSDCEYTNKRVVNEVKQIKTESASPVPLRNDQNKLDKNKKNDRKLDIAALDRMLYATDRVLYPPRKKVGRKPQTKQKPAKTTTKTLKDKNQYESNDSDEESLPANRSVLSGVYAKRKELTSKLANLPKKNAGKSFSSSWRDNQSENEAAAEEPLDPTWKQIDLNPKYKEILSGYKSDYEFKPYKSCSRLIESGYKSDYGCRSGYKSDYYRSGYRSDHKSGYKSDKSGYKTDYSVRSMRRRTRKLKKTRSVRDRSYYKNQKHFVSDQEITSLANKTLDSLTLGNSSSESECDGYVRKPNPSPKYVSVCTKFNILSKYSFGYSKLASKHVLKANPSDPFAPAPVFSGLHKSSCNIFKISHNNNNTLMKSPTKTTNTGSQLPSLKVPFTHKFGSSPICIGAKLSRRDNEKNLKHSDRNLSPKNKRKNGSTLFSKKNSPLRPLPSIFEKAKNSYIPNKTLARNIFLNSKKPHVKSGLHVRKHRRTVVLAPPKINLKPTVENERPSRITVKAENRHRHRSRRRHRSRSVSRCRDSSKVVDSLDQKFNLEMDNIVTSFVKICHLGPKLTHAPVISQPKQEKEKAVPEPAPVKVAKRGSKKRKTSDNQEISVPTTKRRHKKQFAESQNKGGKETNEHKLPLKKRHYHINSSTNNTLSLSLVTSEFDENSKNNSPEKILCTETDCTRENPLSSQSPRHRNVASEKTKKNMDSLKHSCQSATSPSHDLRTGANDATAKSSKGIAGITQTDLAVNIDEGNSVTPTSKNHSPISSNGTDDELSIKKPSAEQSELSKKIYETSEKLKAVHKLVHDLEKSLPKSAKDSDMKMESSKIESRIASPRSESKMSPQRNSAPIVTPKKRHRLEADKAQSHTNLDQVVQSLAKKLSEDKYPSSAQVCGKDKGSESNDAHETNATLNKSSEIDPLKSMSARTLYKSSIPPAQKSEIMTRKKNRLEGLTSNLVSKINPSAATKVLDTLFNNNRKSIESRILEKEKSSDLPSSKADEKAKSKDSSQISTRATVIKSPVYKGKVIDTKKSKTTETLTNESLLDEGKPTGIFEPSIDLEDQIPKSSICNTLVESKTKSKRDSRYSKPLLSPVDPDADIPLALISDPPQSIINRPKRGESIAAVISDKIKETIGGHNLRHAKRNLSNDSDEANDKKKKKTSNLIRESKLVLPNKVLIPKVQAERLPLTETMKKLNRVPEKASSKSNDTKANEPVKKKARRRKTFNRTGFPSVKKKKKKLDITNVQNIPSDSQLVSDTDSAFERIPKVGEATSSFVKRTSNKKPELKVVLNKDDCPKQARLTVVSLEKLQGKALVDKVKQGNSSYADDKKNNSPLLRAPALQLKQNKSDKETKNHVNKWEVLSETDSIPSLASSLGNDPEDCIPLSLLHLKTDRPQSQLGTLDRLKRKSRAMSPSQEVEDIMFSKRKLVEPTPKMGLRPKSSMAVLCPSERRLTRRCDNNSDESNKTKKSLVSATEKTLKAASLAGRRKSRSCQNNKKTREITSSSRESSLDTLVGRRVLNSKSREPSVDTFYRDHEENDPLPLNEKEIDFEKSIDVLSKNIICKKRVASSRDDSPASSVEQRDKPAVSRKNPRLRKKFLVAGLFSDYYKESSKPETKAKNAVVQTDFPPGLLSPPPYCERWVRRRLQHFSLPYDIWWEQHYNQPVPSWNYKKIRTNVYYDVKPSAGECESVACNCAPASGCPEECINRLVFCECSPQLCPCGDKCKNQRIQRHEWASGLEKFMTENKGWGVRTKHTISNGDFILEYVGEVVSDKEFKERMATRYARDTHHYCLHLDGGLVIDGHRMGGDGRFVNHSCRPNCEMQKWTSNGTFRMALFALRDIEPGEELTYDYNFSLFNPAVGQPCKCDSEDCRGVIGGKSQRITKLPLKTQSRTPSNASNQSSSSNQPRVGRPRKASKCNKKSEQHSISTYDVKNMTILKVQQHLNKLWQEPPIKPLTAKERAVVKDRHCFLFRNIEKVRRTRDRLPIAVAPSLQSVPESRPASPLPTVSQTMPQITNVNPLTLPKTMDPSVFLSRIQVLRASKQESKKITVEDDPTLTKKERINKVFRAIYDALLNVTDDKEEQLCAPLLKRKSAKTSDVQVLDIKSIQANIETGTYETVAAFDNDMNCLLTNIMREHGRQSTLGTIAAHLKKVYNSEKTAISEQLTKILGPEEPLPTGFVQKTKPEEVILCVCGLHVEEGLMVQCGGPGCGVWQHARCMRVADTAAPHYCRNCAPQAPPVDREIPLDDYTEEGHQFYLSLMRGDLQIRQGDTVYVLRDIPIDEKHPDVSQKNGEKTESPKTKRVDRKKVKNLAKGKEKEDSAQSKESSVRKHTYQTIGSIPVSELDIFRVERLWKHKDTQERYVYGHHYLRPHETFHEPTRKFFPNEVMRVPLYEAVPIELVMSQCWVMDLNTYCKGRPVGASEEHVYICELRVDKQARLFTKVTRPKYPICTKPYAFEHFPQRLKITRTYAPHEVLPEYLKGRASKNNSSVEKEKQKSITPAPTKEVKKKPPPVAACIEDPKAARERKKERVNGIASRLLAADSSRNGALDASYLLDTRRRRRMS